MTGESADGRAAVVIGHMAHGRHRCQGSPRGAIGHRVRIACGGQALVVYPFGMWSPSLEVVNVLFRIRLSRSRFA